MEMKVYLTLNINTSKVDDEDEDEDAKYNYAQEKLDDWLDTANQFGIIFEEVEVK